MKRTYLRMLCLLVVAAMPVGSAAPARNPHPTDFFTTPDTKASGAPEFAGRPMSDSWANGLQNNDGDMPRIDLISAVPSISGDQRKQLNELYQLTRKQMQPVNDEVNALQKRLKEIRAEKAAASAAPSAVPVSPAVGTKAAPHTVPVSPAEATKVAPLTVAAAPQTKTTIAPLAMAIAGATNTKTAASAATAGAKPSVPEGKPAAKTEPAVDLSWINSLSTEDEVNAKLTEARKKLRDNADLLRDKMFALLTDEQKDEMIAMRHGTLIINSEARTDVPAPAAPAPKAPAKPASPAPTLSTATTAPPKPGAVSINGTSQSSPQAKAKETTAQPLMPR
ncbi:MAG TPA: hypothetical protein V6C69_06465 [Trichormus sp.]|jgi:hypothetical protein